MDLSNPSTLIDRVRRVMPALNFRPESLPMNDDMVRRMRARQAGKLALDGVENLVVYVGVRHTRDADVEALSAAETALEGLSEAAREVCEHLVVVWDDLDGAPQAAAFSVATDGQVGDLLGVSWLQPGDWPDPMIDASITPEEAFEAALRSVGRAAESGPDPRFAQDLQRAVRSVDLALSVVDGEGQMTGELPTAEERSDERASWFARYEASVRDEWHRVHGRLAATRVRAVPARTPGPLSGTRAFVSYARPDSAALARPVVEALRSQGVDVWFDQEEELAPGLLDEGLVATIRGCDVYLLCASDEFFERAGYATQELAWAVEQVGADARLRGIVVVAAPGTVLPRITVDWPVVELRPHDDRAGLKEMLADAIGRMGTSGAARPSSRGSTAAVRVRPSPEVDAEDLLLLVRHRDRLSQVPTGDLAAMVASRGGDSRATRLSGLLRNIGHGLEWDGHLAGHETWPSDPLVRSYRWMLGCQRTIGSLPWPLSGRPEDPDYIERDVEVLATQLPPVEAWPDAVGWTDVERRLLLRFHLGILRVAQDALHRGIFGGMLDVGRTTIESWESQIRLRRQDGVDALVSMRLRGTLSWRGEPPLWEELFGFWLEVLTTGPLVEALPADVWRVVADRSRTLAALAAQSTWLAIRSGEPARRCFTCDTPLGLVEFRSWVRGDEDAAAGADRPRLAVGLLHDANDSTLRLSWSGLDEDGIATTPAPARLAQAMSFPSA